MNWTPDLIESTRFPEQLYLGHVPEGDLRYQPINSEWEPILAKRSVAPSGLE